MDFGDLLWILVLLVSAFGGPVIAFLKKVRDSKSTTEAHVEESLDSDYPLSGFPTESPISQWQMEEEQAPMDKSAELEPEPPLRAAVYDVDKANFSTTADTHTVDDRKVRGIVMNGGLLEESFDLRKAIIYHTILVNDYIKDESIIKS